MAEAWSTVVTREPEYTEHDLIELLSLKEHDAEVHACGLHQSLIDDEDIYGVPVVEQCDYCKAVAEFEEDLRTFDTWVNTPKKDRPNKKPPKPEGYVSPEGRRVRIRILTPEEAEIKKAQQAEAEKAEIEKQQRQLQQGGGGVDGSA